MVSYVGKRADLDFAQFPSPRVTLPAYTRIDVSGETSIAHVGSQRLLLTARVENVLGRSYEDVLHFPAPGRTILIGARAMGTF
jgi:outer membrane cobalamin receptor